VTVTATLPPVVSHLGLTCTDPFATERFYCQHFGFTRERVIFLGEMQIVFLRSGNFCLELFPAKGKSSEPAPEKDGPSYAGFRHLAFRVDDLEATLRGFGREAAITLGPLDLAEHGLSRRIVWLRDPDGRIIEIHE